MSFIIESINLESIWVNLLGGEIIINIVLLADFNFEIASSSRPSSLSLLSIFEIILL